MATNSLIPPPNQTNPILDEIKSHVTSMSPHAQSAIHAAIPMQGISTPPDGGNVRSISPPIQDPQSHPSVPPIGAPPAQHTMNPDPQGSLRPGGSAPPMPILPPSADHVSGPPPMGSIQGQENETQRLIGSGSGASQIQNPIGRGLAETGSSLLHIVAPGIGREVPGTEDHNQKLIQQSQAKTGILQGEREGDTKDDLQQAQETNLEAQPELKAQAGEIAGLKQQETNRHNLATEGNNLRKQGLDQNGKPLGYEELTPHEQGVIDVQKSTEDLKSAQADYERFRSDPNSPQAQAALARVQNAKSNQALGWAKLGLSREHLAFDEDKTYNPEPTGLQRGRGDLGKSSLSNIQDMRDVMKMVPHEFGPGGGRENQFKQWVGSSDPQAVKFRAASEVLSGHFAGMVGARGQYITQQLHDLTNERFNPAALNSVLDELGKTATGFKNAGTPHAKGGTSGFDVTPGGPPQETKQYQGHTYTKGGDGQWHLQAK